MPSTKRTIGAFALAGSLAFGGFACGSSGSKASFCSNAKKYTAKDFKSADSKEFLSAMDTLKSSAPSEIKGDMTYIADWSKKMQSIDTSNPQSAADAMKGMDEKKLQAASDKIDKYLKDKCGIDTNS